jgi:hypothetical protein
MWIANQFVIAPDRAKNPILNICPLNQGEKYPPIIIISAARFVPRLLFIFVFMKLLILCIRIIYI